MHRMVGVTLFGLFLAGTAGCGGGSKVYPVRGTVAYPDGTPAKELAGYKVEFEALDAQHEGRGVSAEGEIQSDGSFRLTTFKADDGAFPGRHRVLIGAPNPTSDIPPGKRLLDEVERDHPHDPALQEMTRPVSTATSR
jgi:hypothetical protein